MYSFKEIVARLVIVASMVIIVETRARYIYQRGPFVNCQELEIPCGGHIEESCNDYCEENGFIKGSCNGQCCLCFARTNGMLPFARAMGNQRSVVNPVRPFVTPNALMMMNLKNSEMTLPLKPRPLLDNKADPTQDSVSKPKRYAAIANNEMNSKSVNGYELKTKLEISIERDVSTVKEEASDVCSTPECSKTAKSIKDNMDETVNPCDDFYQFTCGNFLKDQPIPEDKGSVTLMGSITDKLSEQLRDILNEENSDLPHSALLAKTLYDSCMNTDLLEEIGEIPLTNLLKSIGGWPVLEGDNWNSSGWTWENMIATFRKSGLVTDYLLRVTVTPDLKEPSRRILEISEPLLAMRREQLQNPVFVDAYRNFHVDVALSLGANRTTAEVDMEEVMKFERRLANMSLPREVLRAHPLNFYHPMKISELQIRFPSVNWLTYLKALLPETVNIDENQVVNIHTPDQLVALLKLFQETDNRVLANYLAWRTSSAVLPYLNENLITIQQSFVAKFKGGKERKPRWRECVDSVSATLGQATGALYVRRHFDESSKDIAEEIVNDIKAAFVDILAKMDWMDENTKNRAFEKVAAMKTKIGYPKEILEEENLHKLYAGLELSKDKYFENLLNLTRGAKDYGLGKLQVPIDKNDWIQFGKPAMVNAFYQPITNSIQFPAGILQGHFFDKNRPSFMNYGSIGWVIGHEVTHGYDDQGSHFDLNGDLREWWDPLTKHLFHEKARCLVNQYGRFSYKDLVHNVTVPLNGIVSVGENIADNGGIKQAYDGYRAWVQRNGEEKKLPGLKYTPNQLFWISAATNWCSKVRPQQMVDSIRMGTHSPGQYRVLGTFANMEQFAKDFSCPVGSRMNPETKCAVW